MDVSESVIHLGSVRESVGGPEIIPWPVHKKEYYRDVLRKDPCAYCGRKFPARSKPSSREQHATVDHIEPLLRYTRTNGEQRLNGWENLTGCCNECNFKKDNQKLLFFLHKLHKARNEKNKTLPHEQPIEQPA